VRSRRSIRPTLTPSIALNAYFAELNQRFETGFDPTAGISATEQELRPPAGLLLVAIRDGDP